MKLPSASINGVVSTVIKQFGTGIIIATGFIHVSNLGVDTRTTC
jgi:zinc transporter 1/2/3